MRNKRNLKILKKQTPIRKINPNNRLLFSSLHFQLQLQKWKQFQPRTPSRSPSPIVRGRPRTPPSRSRSRSPIPKSPLSDRYGLYSQQCLPRTDSKVRSSPKVYYNEKLNFVSFYQMIACNGQSWNGIILFHKRINNLKFDIFSTLKF